MVKFLIATHGDLASGFKSSLGIILGKNMADLVETVNAFTRDENPREAIDHLIASLGEGDQLVIFSDWMNGSVNQICTPHASDGKVYVVTGANLPLICEVLGDMGGAARVSENALRAAVDRAKNEVRYVNDLFRSSEHLGSLTDEESFF
jgi:mannose/fructose-specific phosphotransferase system component IIA